MTRFIHLTIIMLVLGLSAHAQVTIGTLEQPKKGALLDLKNIKGAEEANPNATKGLLLPKVILSEKNQLYPMFLDNPEYATNKETIDTEHVGLIVFNMQEDINKLLCFGINVWDGSQWICLRAPAGYELVCNSISVNGIYEQNIPLDPLTHYITISITADANDVGSLYHIWTEPIDGISFEAKGKLVDGTQTITLRGSGTPTTANTKQLVINSNSSVANLCSATIEMVIPKKSMLVIGNESMHGYNISLQNTGSRKLIDAVNNFATTENSKVKYKGFQYLNGSTSDFPQSYGTTPTAARIEAIRKALLEDKIIDILVITQDLYLNSSTSTLADAIVQYLNAGGVVVALWEANGGASLFMNKLFGTTNITDQSINGGGAVYKITNTVNDNILNGPFGDVRDKQWGEDASNTRGLANLPTSMIDVYSTGTDISASEAHNNLITAFKHKTLNFVWFGDGGFTSSGTDGNPLASEIICPLWWNTTTMEPLPKVGYGRGTSKYDVYNSIIYLNIMAWAIDKAENK